MIPAVAQAFVDSDYLVWVDNGRAPRWATDYGYARKIGAVNHIPVADTLEQLRNYFNGGNAQGSTHFGIDRAQAGHLEYGGLRIPVARTDQYMPIRRNAQYPNGCSPWAQGAIRPSSACPIPISPTVANMAQGVPNGAFHSIENVARTGAQGVTDAQFNSNVLMRAYLAGLDEYAITPLTQLWHAEIDNVDRCNDPGWPGPLEDEMQAAANALLNGSLVGLRATEAIAPPPPVYAPPAVRLHLFHKGLGLVGDPDTALVGDDGGMLRYRRTYGLGALDALVAEVEVERR